MEKKFRILNPFFRGLPIIIVVMFTSLLVARRYLKTVTPLYESTAKMRLADTNEGVPNSNLFKDFDVFALSNKISGEIELLKSDHLLNKVLEELDFDIEIYKEGNFRMLELYGKSPIKITYKNVDKYVYEKLINLKLLSETEYSFEDPLNGIIYNGYIGETFTSPNLTIKVSLNEGQTYNRKEESITGNYQFKILNRHELLSHIQENLDITSVDKDVPILRIIYRSSSPEKAQAIVNKITETYIKDYIENKYKAANITVNFLRDQIDVVLKKLSNSEFNIQNYRASKKITNIKQETETDLRQIAQLEIQETNLKMSLEAIKDLEKYIKKGHLNPLELAPNFEAFTYLLSTEMIIKIKAFQAERRDLLLTYTEENEKIKVVDGKLYDLTSYLEESITNTRKNLETKYNKLNNKIIVVKRGFISIPEKERVMNILNREFRIYQQSYNFLNEKKMEAEIAQAARIAFHRIITPGKVSKTPVSPNRPIIQIVSIMLGMFIAITLIYFVHALKAKVNDIFSIESHSNTPIAMLTPKLWTSQEIENHFLQQVVQLEIKGILKNKSSVCISSFAINDGATFNAKNLINALAQQGRKILFIDAENRLDFVKKKQKIPLSVTKNIEVISLTERSFDHYTKDMMQSFIKKFEEQYDLILVLNQKIGDQKSMVLMSVVTTNLIVLDSRLTPHSKIMKADLIQEEYKFDSVQFVLNRYKYNPNLIKGILKESQRVSKTIKNYLRIIIQRIHK